MTNLLAENELLFYDKQHNQTINGGAIMITLVHGDLFYSPARVLVNPVNIMGAMRAGIARDFKRFFPTMFDQYQELCQADEFTIGQLLLYQTPHKWVLNFPIKRHWRADSSLDYIDEGLQAFVRTYADQTLTSVSFPLLGTGNGGLDVDDVLPLMQSYLEPLPISVFIHFYNEDTPFAPDTRNTHAMRRWLQGIPAIVTFETFWADMLDVVQTQDELFTLTDHTAFHVSATDATSKQRLSLKIIQRHADNIFLPETQLRDLWHYVQRAGYVLPQNLPAGLEAHADYIIALLSKLPYVRPIQLARLNNETVIGVHYIPPIIQNDTATVVDMHPEDAS